MPMSIDPVTIGIILSGNDKNHPRLISLVTRRRMVGIIRVTMVGSNKIALICCHFPMENLQTKGFFRYK
jgi:hypothetical protein